MSAVDVWSEVSADVWVRRYEKLDQNIVAIRGGDELLIVDSRSSHPDADVLRDEIAGSLPGTIRWLVNTHYHWDHTFGNARFTDATIIGHTRCRSQLVTDGDKTKEELVGADWVPDAERDALRDVVITPPEVTFDSTMAIHVGDRRVELWHPGRGHTDSDIVLFVDDVCVAGDLVEQGAPPAFGDAFPHDWVGALDALIPRLDGAVVPGHGGIVDADYVRAQRDEIAQAIAHVDGGDSDAPYPAELMDLIRSRIESTRPKSEET